MDQIIKNGAVYIAPNATVVGDVTLDNNTSVWYGAVLRGDCGAIRIGEGTNIQDNCILHSETSIGKGCTVGHGAIVHGCNIEDNALIGMGAIILNGAKIGKNCIIAAGALVPQNKEIPDNSLVMGSPGKIVRQITEEEIAQNRKNAEHYITERLTYAVLDQL